MRPLVVVLVDEGVEPGLLLEDVGRGRSCGVGLQREVEALVPAVLFGVARGDPLQPDAQAQPPHGELAQPIQGVGGGERDAVVRPNGLGQAVVLKGSLEDGEGVAFLRRGEGVAGEQVAAREIGDRQRVAVPPVAEHEFALVVGAPRHPREARQRLTVRPSSIRGNPPAETRSRPSPVYAVDLCVVPLGRPSPGLSARTQRSGASLAKDVSHRGGNTCEDVVSPCSRPSHWG